MNLYEINETIRSAIVFDEETGELLNPSTGEVFTPEEFQAIKVEKKNKIDNLLCWSRNIEADIAGLDAEIERLTKLRNGKINYRDKLKLFVKKVLDGEKMRTDHFSISWRKNESVAIIDIKKIPEDLFLTPKPPEPSKTKIKEAIKAGRKVEGAELVENKSMIVK